MIKQVKVKINIKKELKKITTKDFSGGNGWSDNVTFHCYLNLSEKLKTLLRTEADVVECEYWKDENSCHYNVFEDKNCDEYKVNIDKSLFKALDNILIEYTNQ